MKRTHEEHAARFDEIADEYDDDESEEYRACVSLVVEHADPRPDDTVLDLGCGTTRSASPASRRPTAPVPQPRSTTTSSGSGSA